ncbi:MAG: RIP metalloprotease RseP [Gemmatimonadaceae bacterium]|nr:RIP metalloprotease RseP [Gemmatimonadaceae bacterium]
MLAWLAPLIVFGLVVFVHELGHFLAAKLVGVYAPVFSFGWGPRLWGIRRGETDYRVSWFPVGGFVAMATRDSESASAIEGGTDVSAREPAEGVPGHQRGLNPIPHDPSALKPFGPIPVPPERWVESKPLWAKIFVLSAGVIMNAVLALVVAVGSVYYYGRPYQPAVVDSVVAGRPAAVAGFVAGDSIVSIDGAVVTRWTDMVDRIASSAGTSLAFAVVRTNGERVTLRVTPEVVDEPDPVTGAPTKVGKVGIAPPQRVQRESVALGTAVTDGWTATTAMGSEVFKVVGGLFSGSVSVKQLGGPIRIAQVSFQAAKSGVETLLYLLAFLSINIAVLNLIPLPLLDGGQIVLRIVESIKGSEFSMRTQEYIMRVGVIFLLVTFVLVMFNDIKAIFS